MRRDLGVQITDRGALEEVYNLFKPVEGELTFYYGRIRNGKTYAATADILELLERGESVFANWAIDFQGFDERMSFKHVLLKWFFGRGDFFRYSGDNFHYFSPDDVDVSFLGRLVNAHIFIDEGQWLLNSHQRDHDPEKRKLILHNGHYCRSLNIISQRPINVFKDMRSQINVWYKCEKVMSWPWLLFRRTRFEDMVDDLPDEENPSGAKLYFANEKVLRAYSTHAMRSKDAIEVMPEFDVYRLTRWQRFKLMFSYFVPSLRRHSGGDLSPPPVPAQEKGPDVMPFKSVGDVIEASPRLRSYMDIPKMSH